MSHTARILTIISAAALALTIIAAPADAQANRASSYNLENVLALQGYDPVAYFAEGGGRPREGSKHITHNHESVTYRFATEDNRKRFVANPTRFEPAYGGWCAWAMSEGSKAEIDPESFRIFRGRLFVFYDGLFANTRSKWVKDEAGRMGLADKNWKKLSGEDPPALGRDTTLQNLGDGALAIQGYDPVAYFPEGGGKATKGDARHALTHDGITYHFASDTNKKTFEANPSKYEPLYGGWCAYAIADSTDFVEIDPTSFLVREDGLHLFYDGLFGDTRALWQQDDATFAGKAQSEWKKIVASDRRP